MKFAYADPPYIGQARRHYSHDPNCAEVGDILDDLYPGSGIVTDCLMEYFAGSALVGKPLGFELDKSDSLF
jgi:hypothetical protein